MKLYISDVYLWWNFKCDLSNVQPFQKSNLGSCDFTTVSMSGKIVGLESSYKNITK